MGQPLQKQSEHRQVLDCLTKCLQCVCKEPSRDPLTAAPFRVVLSKVEERKGKEGCNKGLNRMVEVNILGSSVDTRKFFQSFLFLPCNPALRSLHCLSWWVQQRQGGCVCAYVCVCMCVSMHVYVCISKFLLPLH